MSDSHQIMDDCGCVTSWVRQDGDCDPPTWGSVRLVSRGCPEGHWEAYEKMMEWIKRVREDGASDAGGPV